MSAITEFLFPAPAKRTTGAIVGWWEKRRLAYNVAVGSSGLVSLGLTWLLWALPPNGASPGIPWVLPVVFGVAANICYTLGPAVELAIEKMFGRDILPTGPVLYRMGLTFSVGLTFLPVLMSLWWLVVRVVMAIF
jgi:hypothetical protein